MRRPALVAALLVGCCPPPPSVEAVPAEPRPVWRHYECQDGPNVRTIRFGAGTLIYTGNSAGTVMVWVSDSQAGAGAEIGK